MGKMANQDKTGDTAISHVEKAFVPMSLHYEVSRQCHRNSDEYLFTVTSKFHNTKLGTTTTETITEFTFQEEELLKMRFKLDGYSDPITFEDAGKFYRSNILGKNRNRVDALKEQLQITIRKSFRQSTASDYETFWVVLQKLQTGKYNDVLREIGKRESLWKMAMKPAAW